MAFEVTGRKMSSFQEQVMTRPGVAERFGDLHPPLGKQAAALEANRCLYCFDAPCAGACPTHIDVPRFIKKIATGNLGGSARTILDAEYSWRELRTGVSGGGAVRGGLCDAPIQ